MLKKLFSFLSGSPDEVINQKSKYSSAEKEFILKDIKTKIEFESILMPKMADEMTEAKISNWLVKEGSKVKENQAIAEVETDKATMELESYLDGYIYLLAENKKMIPVDGLIAIIAREKLDFSHYIPGEII